MIIDNAEDLKERALEYKTELKKQQIELPIGDEDYAFRVSGIGAKSVKIEKYIKYEDIFEAIEAGNNNGLEAIIKEFIEEYEEEDEE